MKLTAGVLYLEVVDSSGLTVLKIKRFFFYLRGVQFEVTMLDVETKEQKVLKVKSSILEMGFFGSSQFN